jgi:hypothetical protein
MCLKIVTHDATLPPLVGDQLSTSITKAQYEDEQQ